MSGTPLRCLPAILGLLLGGQAIAQEGAAANPGAALFKQHCEVCHSPGGVGTPGYAPPLAGALASRFALPGGKDYFARIVLGGLAGPIQLAGASYNGAMPGFAALADSDLAAILNQVLGQWNGLGADPLYQGADVAALRPAKPSSGDNRKLREALDKLLAKGG